MPARLDTVRSATHLTTDQLEGFRRLLVGEFTNRQARAVELQDPVDLEPDLADVLLARCLEAMDEINAALARIGDGTYGTCVACGDPIPAERLEIVPAADRCVACQADRDRVLR
jgi:RNA polymerase-binding transcription factor DksA